MENASEIIFELNPDDDEPEIWIEEALVPVLAWLTTLTAIWRNEFTIHLILSTNLTFVQRLLRIRQ